MSSMSEMKKCERCGDKGTLYRSPYNHRYEICYDCSNDFYKLFDEFCKNFMNVKDENHLKVEGK